MSEYLEENNRTLLSNIIFSIRSRTLDIKNWQPWKYSDLLCVKCELYPETIEHFVKCIVYGNPLDTNWTDILENDVKKQTKVGLFIENRYKMREKIIKQQEDGRTSTLGSICNFHSLQFIPTNALIFSILGFGSSGPENWWP